MQYFDHYNLPSTAGDKRQFCQLSGSSVALVCANIVEQHTGLTILLTRDRQHCTKIVEEVKQFTDKPVFTLVDWETLPYDNFSPNEEITSERLACLHQLMHINKGLLVIPVATYMQRVCPHAFLAGHVLLLKKQQHITKEALREQLELAGYHAVEQVLQHGEFASRGAILDLFPMGSELPYRLDFFDNEIDSIRTFDVDSQRTLNQVDKINLLPAHEFPFNKQSIELFRSQWREIFDVSRDAEHIYQQISKAVLPSGIEYWQPLFFQHPLVSLSDYFPSHTLMLTNGNIHQGIENFWQDIQHRYENRRHDRMRPLLKPETLWLTPNELAIELKKWPQVQLSQETLTQKSSVTICEYTPLPSLAFAKQASQLLEPLRKFCDAFSGKIIFSVESEGRKETLLEFLRRLKISPQTIPSLKQLHDKERYYIMLGACEHGFIDEKNNIAFICESDLLGEKVSRPKRNTKKTVNIDTLVRHLAELKIGQPVVHIEHGIGRYAGLTTLDAGGIKAEYLIILYANDAKLYVPVSSLHLISRYSGSENEQAPLHKLGSDVWARTRNKAAEKINDVAAELLDIYANREIKTGFTFKQDNEQYRLFCQGFPFEPTEDQLQAINAVLSDMCQGKSMDRLVCGDVGFGKTEVAMRAAFLAVLNHKQVAVLVPTTLLAQQHFENFKDRFANWPIKVEVISRFKSAKEQQDILAETVEGKVDILIGTHKLLQSDIKWHDLGLLIIDEEHRFGVKQKERLKSMRTNVDILTLTATPIPRTLNMALGGMRDLSIIATPPARRLAIKTFVRQHDDLLIREAILREILRGGQVYYLSNDVQHIEKTREKLESLVPEARFGIGHGQMNERELERVMMDFHHQRFNVLICTTIIETGIDIPNANTIIIERADRFGLAQLHQLRGRVGRSYHQAYAYLLTPSPKVMTKEAKQRLQAIASLEDLGAGFALATHDLEIRGAGELLGEEQSGQIESIGFSLYMELLEKAIENLKQGNKYSTLDDLINAHQTEIDLKLPALLPDEYVSDINNRLSLYKRIASANNDEELNEIKVEVIDRFGPLPEPTRNLFDVAVYRLLAKKLGIKKIDANNKGGNIEFNTHNYIDPTYLIGLLQKPKSVFKLDGPTKLKFTIETKSYSERLHYIKQLLTDFSEHQTN